MTKINRVSSILVAMVTTSLMSSCLGTGSGQVTLKVKAVSLSAGTTSKTNLTTFKVCAENVLYFDSSGQRIEPANNYAFTTPVNADLSKGTEVSLGSVNSPTGFDLGKIAIIASHNGTECPVTGSSGGSFAVIVNDKSQTDGDIQLSFNINPAVQISGGETITLDVQSIADAAADKVIGGTLTNTNVKTTIEAAVGTATVTK